MTELSELRKRHSSKWRRYPADVLPMHVAEMDFAIADAVRDRIVTMATNSDLGYLGPVPELGEAFAGFAKDRWGWSVDTKQFKLVTDVGVGVVEFLRGNGATGGKVIINSPVYHGFWHWLEELDIEIVDVPLKANYDLDIEGIEKQFEAGVKYLLLCNPQNPVGKVFRKSELQELARVANKHGAVVISDEIHAPLVYKEHEFAPYLSCGTDAEETGVCITSASKSWNLAGLKGAFVITASPKMLGMLNKLPEAAHWRSSILAAFAMVEAFENGRDWLDETLEKLDRNRHHLKAELARLLPSAKYEIPESTYLAWIEVEQWGLGEKTVETLIEHAKVALVPGNEHGPEYTNFVRFNFGTSPELITEGLTRIAAFLNK
ncbi:MAG: hypothetical protein RL140_59 [Actinomycetota bacterium]|jgi:cystathionine beta-lyase